MSCSSPRCSAVFFFFFNATAPTEIYTLSLHDALPISAACRSAPHAGRRFEHGAHAGADHGDRKSTRLNSSHVKISYAVFCLKNKIIIDPTRKLFSIGYRVGEGTLDPGCYDLLFFFNDPATSDTYTLSLHDALPI